MSSYLCFICHNVVDSATTEETREKYREVVGINLCLYSHLCYACCHLVNKLWKFKSVCLKRSLEYPVLFSEKCTLNLIRSDVEVLVLCDETCIPTNRTQVICYNNETKDQSNDYVELEDERNDIDDLLQETSDNIDINTEETVINDVLPTEMDTNVTESDDVNDGDMINYFDDNKIENDVIDRDDSLSPETSNKKKTKKNEKSDFKKIILSLEEQKAELDAQRKTKKYLEAEFKCYNCAQGFLFKDSYQTHMMRHEESNGEYVCVVCTVRFASVAVLRSHVSGHTERYRCRHCARHVRKRQRLTHLRGHGVGGGEAACHLCGNVFQDGGGLQQHLKRFHRSKASTRSYPCGVCGRTYNTQAAVRSHMITHLQHKFVCSSCGATFSSPYSLTQHKKRHSASGAAHHQCAACGRRYHTRKSLLAHMRNALQHQDTVYECPICSRICPNSTSLSLHIARVHSTTKDFACNRCPKKYTSRNSLMRHVREHTSCKTTVKAQCFVCGKSFKNNSRLNRHLREVCRKDKLEEELSAYNLQQDGLLVDMGNQEIGN